MRYEIGRFITAPRGLMPTPSIRFMTWAALRVFLRDSTYRSIEVNIETNTDYCLSPSMEYFEIAAKTNVRIIDEIGGYAILKRYADDIYPNFDDDVTGTEAHKVCFLVFVNNIEFSQITNTIRYYYTVDWWDTLLMWGVNPRIYGICERAHVDDITDDGRVLTDYFTDEIEFPIPKKEIVSATTPAQIPEVVLSTTEANKYYNTYPVYYLYITLGNTSSLKGGATEAEGIDEWNGLQIGVGTPSTTVCTLYSARTGKILSPKLTSFPGGYALRNLTNEHIISMYLSITPPFNTATITATEAGNFYINGLPNDRSWLLTTDGSDDFSDEKTIVVYPAYSGYLAKWQGSTIDGTRVIKERLDEIVKTNLNYPLNDGYIQHYYGGYSPDEPTGAYDDYLNNFIVKSHMYPYAYYSFIRGSTKVDLVSEWLVDQSWFQINILHDKPTDTYVLLLPMKNAYGVETVYSFDYPTLFEAPYKQSWLDRTTSLEAGAFQIAGSAVGVISSAGAAMVGGIMGNPFALGGGAAGAAGSAISLLKSSIAWGRELRLTDEGYFVRGSLPTQAVASIDGSAGFYMKYTMYTREFAKQLNTNLHYFGYHTLVDAGDIVNGIPNHRRKVFNFVKTVSCNVLGGDLPLDVKSDIKDMFDRGVWLFSVGNIDFSQPNPPDYSVR